MVPIPDDDLFDRFLSQRGHDINPAAWERDYNKKRCPECSGLHDTNAIECSVCGWTPQ